MKVLGITGGVGAGKSLVLSYLGKKSNVVVYEADAIAKELQKQGGPCLPLMIDRFGAGILTEEGELNRKKLGEIVFGDEIALDDLNKIVHPLVRERIEELIDVHKNQDTQVFVLEAAILLEVGYDDICNEVWYIHADSEVRRLRLNETRNYTEALFQNISKHQMTEEDYKKYTHCMIHNNGDIQQLYQLIEGEYNRFLGEQ